MVWRNRIAIEMFVLLVCLKIRCVVFSLVWLICSPIWIVDILISLIRLKNAV